MKTGRFQYLCRRCKEIKDNPCTGATDSLDPRLIMLLLDAIKGCPRETQAPEMHGICSCKDGKGLGVTDLIGVEVS